MILVPYSACHSMIGHRLSCPADVELMILVENVDHHAPVNLHLGMNNELNQCSDEYFKLSLTKVYN